MGGRSTASRTASSSRRSARARTSARGAKVAYLEKEDFEKSMGPIEAVLKRSADSVKKDDLEEYAILGTGTFGKVKLDKHTPTGNVFAMKIISKQKVIQYNQQEHVMNEKRIMA